MSGLLPGYLPTLADVALFGNDGCPAASRAEVEVVHHVVAVRR